MRSVGPELGHASHHAAHVDGTRQHRPAEPVHAPGRGPGRPETRAQQLGDRPHRTTQEVRRRAPDQDHPDDPGTEELGPLLRHGEDRHGAHRVADDHRGTIGRGGGEDGSDVTAHAPQREVTVGGRGAGAVRAMVEGDHAEVAGQLRPQVAPHRHVEAEPVREEEDGPRGVAGGPDGELGAVEGGDRAEVLGGQVPDRGRVGVAPLRDRAPDDADRERPRSDPRHERRTTIHPTCSRGHPLTDPRHDLVRDRVGVGGELPRRDRLVPLRAEQDDIVADLDPADPRNPPSAGPSSRCPPPCTADHGSRHRPGTMPREGSRPRSRPAPSPPTRRVRARSGARSSPVLPASSRFVSETLLLHVRAGRRPRCSPDTRGRGDPVEGDAGTDQVEMRPRMTEQSAAVRCVEDAGRQSGGARPSRRPPRTPPSEPSWCPSSSSLRAKWVHRPSSTNPASTTSRTNARTSAGGHTPARCMPVSTFTWTRVPRPRAAAARRASAASRVDGRGETGRERHRLRPVRELRQDHDRRLDAARPEREPLFDERDAERGRARVEGRAAPPPRRRARRRSPSRPPSGPSPAVAGCRRCPDGVQVDLGASRRGTGVARLRPRLLPDGGHGGGQPLGDVGGDRPLAQVPPREDPRDTVDVRGRPGRVERARARVRAARRWRR